MLVLEQEDQELFDRIQEKNPVRQYDLLTNCIEIGLSQGRSRIRQVRGTVEPLGQLPTIFYVYDRVG